LLPADQGNREWRAGLRSVMIARLKKVDSPLTDPVNDTMLGSEASGPSASRILEWLRLANANERIPGDRLYQLKDTKSCVAVRFDPVTEIVSKFRMENCKPLSERPAQVPSPASVWKPIPVFPLLSQPGAAR
jgi:hypothetical protein